MPAHALLTALCKRLIDVNFVFNAAIEPIAKPTRISSGPFVELVSGTNPGWIFGSPRNPTAGIALN